MSTPLKTVIEPQRGFQMPNFKEIWSYRELFGFISERYSGSVQANGFRWSLGAYPTLYDDGGLFVSFGKFAKVPSDGFPYPIFLYSALLPWTLFASTLSQSSNAILGSSYVEKSIFSTNHYPDCGSW